MTRKELADQIFSKRSYLCIGLDTDSEKIPKHLLSSADPVFEFNKQIIDATKDLCVSYKINTAFYEANGVKGWQSLEKTVNYIPSEHFKIADAKRGDIGNTSSQYAKAFFPLGHFRIGDGRHNVLEVWCRLLQDDSADGVRCLPRQIFDGATVIRP